MTIIPIPVLGVKDNNPDKNFTFDSPMPLEGGFKKVYLGYYHPENGQDPIPIALARPRKFPQIQHVNEEWENELIQI